LLSEDENQRTYGKCNNPYGHGHDYVLDISVAGEVNPATGLILKLSTLDRFVQNEILASFAYRNLNHDVSEFQRLVPTTENVALVIAARLHRRWADYFTYSYAYVSSISVYETDRNSFEVLLPRPLLHEPHELHEQSPPVHLNESVIVNA
jgi:6-pyruvoyltetrahydropterin/6-carboxytetrahydropterin synthase